MPKKMVGQTEVPTIIVRGVVPQNREVFLLIFLSIGQDYNHDNR